MRTYEARLERASAFLELVAHVWPKLGPSVARGYASGPSNDHWPHGPEDDHWVVGSMVGTGDHWVQGPSRYGSCVYQHD